MIIAEIGGGLGNQLFNYAATKSIALDLGYEYRYIIPDQSWAVPKGATIDIYGNEFDYYFEKAFHIDNSERITHLPPQIKHKWTWERLPSSNFNPEVYKVLNNTLLCGCFLSSRYFEHRRAEVLKWFCFQDKYRELCALKRKHLIAENGADRLIAIHMRYSKDRRYLRLTIDPEYYKKAIRKVESEHSNERMCYLLFSDNPKEAIRLIKNINVSVLKGNMYEDLCLMSMCDTLIISNSTFSWWGAWLADDINSKIIRPSIYPIVGKKLGPQDYFPKRWESVEAKREGITVRIFINRCYDEYPINIMRAIRKAGKRIKAIAKIVLPPRLAGALKQIRINKERARTFPKK